MKLAKLTLELLIPNDANNEAYRPRMKEITLHAWAIGEYDNGLQHAANIVAINNLTSRNLKLTVTSKEEYYHDDFPVPTEGVQIKI